MDREPDRASPEVYRRRLSGELRRLREAAGFTATDVGRKVGWPTSTVTRKEAGLWKRPNPTDVAALLDVYGVAGADRDRLLDLARRSRERGWWVRYQSLLSPPYMAFLGVEEGASKAWSFEPQALPPLLQTEEYTRAFLACRYPQLIAERPEMIDDHLAVLQRRRRSLTGPSPIELWVMIDEIALRRAPLGCDDSAMRRALEQVLRLASRTNIMLQVVPLSAGVHAGLNPFTVLRFQDPLDPEIGWAETAYGAELLEDQPEVRRLEEVWHSLVPRALTCAASERLLHDLLAGQGGRPDHHDLTWSG